MARYMSEEEKKRLSYERENAVRLAWKEERERVARGEGTRRWTVEEQKELLEKGYVSGYEGHHMKCVSLYPEYAGNPKNIQFLTEEEHLEAHRNCYQNLTYSYYDPETKQFSNTHSDELEDIPVYKLSQFVESETNNENQINNIEQQKSFDYETDLNQVRAEYEKANPDNQYVNKDINLETARAEYERVNSNHGIDADLNQARAEYESNNSESNIVNTHNQSQGNSYSNRRR